MTAKWEMEVPAGRRRWSTWEIVTWVFLLGAFAGFWLGYIVAGQQRAARVGYELPAVEARP